MFERAPSVATPAPERVSEQAEGFSENWREEQEVITRQLEEEYEARLNQVAAELGDPTEDNIRKAAQILYNEAVHRAKAPLTGSSREDFKIMRQEQIAASRHFSLQGDPREHQLPKAA